MMAIQSWLVFTPAQNTQVLSESENTDMKIAPRLIDGAYVDNLGDPLLTSGNYVAPSRVLVGEEYEPVWGNTWVASLPIRNADSDVLFAPPEV